MEQTSFKKFFNKAVIYFACGSFLTGGISTLWQHITSIMENGFTEADQVYVEKMVVLLIFIILLARFRKFWIAIFIYPVCLIKMMLIDGDPFESTIPCLFFTIGATAVMFILFTLDEGDREIEEMEKITK